MIAWLLSWVWEIGTRLRPMRVSDEMDTAARLRCTGWRGSEAVNRSGR